VKEMYPSGISQDVGQQKGTFVEVKGYGEQMEGRSRPTFFRGVATVVLKLFNAIEPTHAYFGQKDLQQALLLRRMARDVLLAHPTPENLHIVPTARDPVDGLALSSRNAYLSPAARSVAPILYAALNLAKAAWEQGKTTDEALASATALIDQRKAKEEAKRSGVSIRLDYLQMNDSDTFEELPGKTTRQSKGVAEAVMLTGAMWVDRTRLIDNIIIGNPRNIIR
jgi:pantoate--beta-alanine ligase